MGGGQQHYTLRHITRTISLDWYSWRHNLTWKVIRDSPAMAYKDVTRTLQDVTGRYTDVTRTLHGRYTDVTRSLQGRYKSRITDFQSKSKETSVFWDRTCSTNPGSCFLRSLKRRRHAPQRVNKLDIKSYQVRVDIKSYQIRIDIKSYQIRIDIKS